MAEDWLKTHVLEVLHAAPDGHRALVRDLAASHPQLPALALEEALAAAAEEMDAAIRRGGSSTDEARNARRLALLLSLERERTGRGAEATIGALSARLPGGDAPPPAR